MSKVTVVGAGNVGATCANVLAFNEVADEVVMLDVKEGVSEGKAMDMMQTAQLLGFDTTVTGCTNDYEKTANSDVVVITSGIPRKPGMTREELIGVNAGIVKSVAQNILKYSPNAILVVISNPMDTMTYLSLKSLGLPKNRIIGMGGALDSSRFKYFLSQALGCNANEVEGMVIGGHGDTTMIPLARLATYKGIPVSKLLSAEKLQEVVASTMVGGATLTKLLGTSAWYAPGAAGAYVVESIIHNQKKMVPCSVYLEGEYGESDLCIGVPVILGKNGIEKIVELELTAEEKELRKLGVDEDTIQRLHTYDWAQFNKERQYLQRQVEWSPFVDLISAQAIELPVENTQALLDSIENAKLLRILSKEDKLTLQIILYKLQDYTSIEIAKKIGLTETAVRQRISRLKKKFFS